MQPRWTRLPQVPAVKLHLVSLKGVVMMSYSFCVSLMPLLHVSLNDETMQDWPGLSMSADSITPSREVFWDYVSHPYWTDETMFISLPASVTQ